MKEVLVVYYSQTGQQQDILKNIMQPFNGTATNITYHEIKPIKDYPFPWPKLDFFDVFPESFLQIPTELEAIPVSVLNKKYDLIILGYTVWYLTPSIPINSFLKSNEGKKLLKDTPVVTVIGARNMWIMAQEKMKHLLVNCGARLVGNIALVDRNINHISLITIQHWMLDGKKDRKWGVFPKPGVSEKDISEASKFGHTIQEALMSNQYDNLQDNLLKKDAVTVIPSLIATDKRGNVVFSKWANMLIKKGGPNSPKRRKILPYFNYYMIFAIWVIAPIVFIVFLLTYLPLYGRIKKQKQYYASVQLKQD
ncbi:dialkylrecorsinol condensing protein DarA [Patiriisocius marinistellae]|uniref:Dialkylrecorsinol condensing protein DarA n=1 Tax=Patiriisocius marinistellae TaxID=2494560 RepID=A0A5J4FU20_9FLAO|nr:dialkylrecorsinol condensing enzyme DarA [Patiriisocius marinistellae]GEQ85223.1 dialkylrecorsinol condensing protein DarA [Patiriisocius marinistellae]